MQFRFNHHTYHLLEFLVVVYVVMILQTLMQYPVPNCASLQIVIEKFNLFGIARKTLVKRCNKLLLLICFVHQKLISVSMVTNYAKYKSWLVGANIPPPKGHSGHDQSNNLTMTPLWPLI